MMCREGRGKPVLVFEIGLRPTTARGPRRYTDRLTPLSLVEKKEKATAKPMALVRACRGRCLQSSAVAHRKQEPRSQEMRAESAEKVRDGPRIQGSHSGDMDAWCSSEIPTRRCSAREWSCLLGGPRTPRPRRGLFTKNPPKQPRKIVRAPKWTTAACSFSKKAVYRPVAGHTGPSYWVKRKREKRGHGGGLLSAPTGRDLQQQLWRLPRPRCRRVNLPLLPVRLGREQHLLKNPRAAPIRSAGIDVAARAPRRSSPKTCRDDGRCASHAKAASVRPDRRRHGAHEDLFSAHYLTGTAKKKKPAHPARPADRGICPAMTLCLRALRRS